MGLFLHVALFPGLDVAARRSVERAAQKLGVGLHLEACQYAQNVQGTQVLLEGTLECEGLAEELSRVC